MVIAVGVLAFMGVVGGIILVKYSCKRDVVLDHNICDKLDELPPIFEQAKDAIKISTDFDPGFFDDTRVMNALGTAIAKGTRVAFLTDEENPPQWYRDRSGIEIKQVKELKNHRMIIDDQHIRLEKPHAPNTFGENKDDIALIFKNFPQLARRYSQEFDESWEKS